MSDLPPLAWHHVIHPAAKDGTLAAYLDTLPRERWTEVGPAGKTLLHYACLGDNVPAALALVKHGLDVEAIDLGHWTPAHTAVYKQAPRVLEVLCALSADLRARTANNDTPIDLAICHYPRTHETGRVLLANGVRLATARDRFRRLVPPELVAFERGVLRCRAATVALLRVKRASGKMARWDRFLLAELALCVWATRTAVEWGKE